MFLLRSYKIIFVGWEYQNYVSKYFTPNLKLHARLNLDLVRHSLSLECHLSLQRTPSTASAASAVRAGPTSGGWRAWNAWRWGRGRGRGGAGGGCWPACPPPAPHTHARSWTASSMWWAAGTARTGSVQPRSVFLPQVFWQKVKVAPRQTKWWQILMFFQIFSTDIAKNSLKGKHVNTLYIWTAGAVQV